MSVYAFLIQSIRIKDKSLVKFSCVTIDKTILEKGDKVALKQIELSLRKCVAPEFVFGLGARKLAGKYAKNLGSKSIFLLSQIQGLYTLVGLMMLPMELERKYLLHYF